MEGGGGRLVTTENRVFHYIIETTKVKLNLIPELHRPEMSRGAHIIEDGSIPELP